ncbi:fused MFS/spermidine synthase [Tellurirhabdus rosea]|uniref:fused MFS/spermidine synthase n=1 Tax=Tellurirhabdus rosea TaxID=2674997 RepID=UPI00224F52F8|nr:fused MFS/spermidine synthase [Tellurirhabdus rosea]
MLPTALLPSRLVVRLTLAVLLGLFFLSGFAALLYQVIWQRMLVFYTGSDTVSISLIVTAFMSGLGIGYLVGGRLADRSRPATNLLYFVVAELGILLFAAFSKRLLYDWLYESGPAAGENILLLYALVFGVLLVPTFLMGVSLPVLSRAFRLGDMGEQSRYISLLYFVNTLGAAFGALATGVVLVRAMGYERALWVGMVFNGLCAVGALALGLWLRRFTGSATEKVAGARTEPLSFTPTLTAWSVQYALSGFAALSLELIWFRILETLIKSVSLTFSILLAIYLGSMALGTAVGSWLTRGRSAAGRERIFLLAQLGLYLYTGLSVGIFVNAISRMDSLRYLWDYFASYEPNLSLTYGFPTYVLIPMFLLFVPTFLMGLSFSVSQSLIQDKYEEVGRKVGWLQFINIVGSALGAWWVTWVGFPVFGTAMLLKGIAAFGFIYCLLLFSRKYLSLFGTLGLTTLLLLAVMILPGNFRLWRQLNGIPEDDRFLYDENQSGLSIIKLFPEENTRIGVVFANGLGQSIMPYHRDAIHTLLGGLPVLIHPNPQKVAVIGLGSSGTLNGIAARPETREIVCFEIMSNQPDVLSEYAAQAGDTAIARVLDDRRLRLVLHDGRYQLRTMPDRYDVIEADALRPNSAFSGNIYSLEYFQLLKERLKPGGMAVSWCPTPRVLTTFCKAFPYVAYAEGFMLIGSNQPIRIDWQAVRERLNHPFTKAHFGRSGIDMTGLVAPYEGKLTVLAPGNQVAGEVNTDLYPRDEYSLPEEWKSAYRRYRGYLRMPF